MLELLTKELDAHRHPENARQMENYMKNHFPFFGIKTPERRKITTQFLKETGLSKQPFNSEFVLELWEKDEREYQNIALDYIEIKLQNISKEHISLLEKLITTKSWWDTVDMLAQKPIGKIAADSSEVIHESIEDWSTNENMWLRRTSILFQLKYKEKTDEELLYKYIKRNTDSKEFFIQKAIGWALREYSKTNPNSVRTFIQQNALAKLSIREGSKYI
ncbi:DNA alkylation repair protein [Paucisalibacillus globulus]|uniref:DNA alkylation repair protein n=1 Tax=Paucisalibacillus globulus TaxID=351095 RepID=UPI000411C1DA|nr:DNA alkylation repair protein [Paucisalibacillus globulus]